jgi:hypothetical protein
MDIDGEEISFVIASGTGTVAFPPPEEALLPAPEVGTLLAPAEFEVQYS